MSKAIVPNREERVIASAGLEVRAKSGSDMPQIVGYAAVFNQPSVIIADWFSKFREYVSPGAFAKTLADGADVRALINHDPNFVLGRTKSGTLSLKEDDKGLWMEITPPNTQWARDLIATMRRGDVDQSSFGFQTVRDRWGTGKDDEGNEIDERWVLEARLFDVSTVTFPAYPQTEANLRSLLGDLCLDPSSLARVMHRVRLGQLSEADTRMLQSIIDELRSYLPTQAANIPTEPPAEPTQASHSDMRQEPTHTGHSQTVDWGRLDRLESLIGGTP